MGPRPRLHCFLVCIRPTQAVLLGATGHASLSSGTLKRGCPEQRCTDCEIHTTQQRGNGKPVEATLRNLYVIYTLKSPRDTVG